MMLIASYLWMAGFFDWAADWILRQAPNPQRLLLYVIITSGTLSALLVNDTVCLMLTPLVVAVMVRGKLPLTPYLLALAMSANLGSVRHPRRQSSEHDYRKHVRVCRSCASRWLLVPVAVAAWQSNTPSCDSDSKSA
jgi:hypothetical protein